MRYLRKGHRVKTKAAREALNQQPFYLAQDGRPRFVDPCKSCDGFGTWNWRDQRRVGLSAKKGDPHIRCEHCKGTGVVVKL